MYVPCERRYVELSSAQPLLNFLRFATCCWPVRAKYVSCGCGGRGGGGRGKQRISYGTQCNVFFSGPDGRLSATLAYKVNTNFCVLEGRGGTNTWSRCKDRQGDDIVAPKSCCLGLSWLAKHLSYSFDPTYWMWSLTCVMLFLMRVLCSTPRVVRCAMNHCPFYHAHAALGITARWVPRSAFLCD